MYKKAVLIISPGGNGNHMWDEILTTAGSIKHGDNDFGAPRDCEPTEDFIHWFRSMPHPFYPMGEIARMIDYLVFHGYDPFALIPVRDWYCVSQSQLTRHGAPNQIVVFDNMQLGYQAIVETYHRKLVHFMFVTYSEAVHQPEYVKWVLRHLGLPDDKLPELRDENAKWYNK